MFVQTLLHGGGTTSLTEFYHSTGDQKVHSPYHSLVIVNIQWLVLHLFT